MRTSHRLRFHRQLAYGYDDIKGQAGCKTISHPQSNVLSFPYSLSFAEMKFSPGLAAVAASFAVSGVTAVAEWGQCGGLTYSGSTVCDSPWVCVYQNDYYSQCLPGTTSTTTSKTSSTPTTTKSSTTTTKSSTTTTESGTPTTTTSASPWATTRKFKLFGS